MEQLIEAHLAEYEARPDIILEAPGRFHLIGDHSWYFKDKTLSMAVDLPVYMAISVRNDTAVRFYFHQLKERKRANVSSLKFRKEDRWANVIKAVLYSFEEFGLRCKGMNITVWSEILPSAGFGITTALKVVSALAFKELFHPECTEEKLLKIMELGNRQFLGVGNYVADIFTAMFAKEGTCLLTDHSKNNFVYLPFDFEDYSIILTDARVPRISVWNEDLVRTPENFLLLAELKVRKNGFWVYEDSEIEINDILSGVNEDTRRRLLCIMKEHKNVLDAVEGLKTSNFQLFARAVNKSHEAMRDMFNISCPEIDWLVKRVLEMDPTSSARNPTSCSRITGKGFGRCSYSIIKKTDIENYVQKLGEYERIFGFHPSYYEVKPSAGAHVVESFAK